MPRTVCKTASNGIKLFFPKDKQIATVCAVWAVIQFMPNGRNAQRVVVAEEWNDTEMREGDIAVGIGARGIKNLEVGGVFRSSFEQVVAMYANPKEQQALSWLVEYVRITSGKEECETIPPAEAYSTRYIAFQKCSLSSIMWGLLLANNGIYECMCKDMFKILTGLYRQEKTFVR